MQLPTQAEVNAASRHAASFAGGAILAFGLSTKIDPDTVKSIIAATGTAVNDIIVLIGMVTPLVAGYFAKQSASPVAQAQAVASAAAAKTLPPEAQVAVLNAASDVPGTQKVVNPALAADPATSTKVTTS
jgi:predicted lipid-binding transport protein (Tim44 family)